MHILYEPLSLNSLFAVEKRREKKMRCFRNLIVMPSMHYSEAYLLVLAIGFRNLGFMSQFLWYINILNVMTIWYLFYFIEFGDSNDSTERE